MNAVLIKKSTILSSLCRFLFIFSCPLFSSLLQAEEAIKESKKKLVFSSEPIGTDVVLQLVLSMALVIGVIVLLAWLMRRVGGIRGQAGGNMRILGGLSLGTREKLVLVKVGDTQLLLGVAPGQVRKLHVLDKPVSSGNDLLGSSAVTAEQKNDGSSFSDRLKSALGKGSA